MGKKVRINGIEILTSEDDRSARELLIYVETVISRLEIELDHLGGNFHLLIKTDFSPDGPPQHFLSTRRLTHAAARKKVVKILEKSASIGIRASGTVKIQLDVEDE